MPSGEKATLPTSASCPLSWRSSLPVSAAHSRTTRSWPAEARILPPGAKPIARTTLSCPSRAHNGLPLATSHKRTLPSELAVTSVLPSLGEKARAVTSLCPVKRCSFFPVSESHRITAEASDPSPFNASFSPAATVRPSGDKATTFSQMSCCSRRRSFPVAASSTRTV